ncbi:MAG: type II toxin-antitoxin system mRNA interferase toxin, RelE/StbE family [Candidatus Magasanikbacteria bacterium]|nr:type II toxin-antitoxin system mRNA interferase toxin, RelE/StbE family [Candidatus Magasanikbacteria bacterium]
MLVKLSSRFTRAYQKLPTVIQADFKTKVAIFITNPRHPLLKTHKLKGRLQECLAFRLNQGYRVLFEFAAADQINLLDVGPHDIYRRY